MTQEQNKHYANLMAKIVRAKLGDGQDAKGIYDECEPEVKAYMQCIFTACELGMLTEEGA
jgi:hypothetical protein